MPRQQGFREDLPPGKGGRVLKPGERPRTAFGAPVDPFGELASSRGATRRRYAEDLSGYRPMPELACPNPACGGHVERKFGTREAGSLVPHHALRCSAKCGFVGLIRGKVLPIREDGTTIAPGVGPTRAQMVAGFRAHLDRMWREKLPEVNLTDSLE